ncbi:MAG: peptidase T [Bacilli bacterium]|jgi:tripeptide aminopeptidase|nr:peptidase T [Bacilli bacterium]
MDNENLLNRFIEYTKINTQSNPNSESIPSSPNELDLIKLLEKQLKEWNLDVKVDQYGYLTLLIKANTSKKVPAIGFLAHCDTAPDYSGANVNAQVIKNYQGQDIPFKDGDKLSAEQFKDLNNYLNQTIICTDGTTLLGCDDKGGIAIIMEAIKYFIDNPEIEHGDIYIAFTLDEEVGTGVDHFDLANFKPDFAYTIDGEELGEFNYETFNAAALSITFKGLNVHPGNAKNVMINSMEKALQFHSKLPAFEKPEYTEKYEGFYMLNNIEGNVEKTTMNYIIRDHSKELFEYRKNVILKIIEECQKNDVNFNVEYDLKDQYYNMAEKVKEKQIALDLALKAYELNNVKANVKAIRGGTDGSKLSFKGIPCPNIFTGAHNLHGKYEYACLESMAKARDIIIDIIKLACT